MFYVRFLGAELRRRPGRTALTALGLAVGVGLVVIVSALSAGLDDAQAEALAPLTGVGTDMRVSRPLALPGAGERGGPGAGSLSDDEQRKLEKENPEGLFHFEPSELGEPGERFTKFQTLSSDLSFPRATVEAIARLDGARDASAALALQTLRIEGDVPEPGTLVDPHSSYDITSLNVTGVDVAKPRLAPVTPGQIAEGAYFSREARDEAIVDLGYARQNGIAVGETTKVAGRRFDVVGLAAAPVGGAAPNVYLELGRLQQLSDRRRRVNVMLVRADSTGSVDRLSGEIRDALPGAVVVSADDLAGSVSGSLVDARNLSTKLGTALAVVALGAAFLIATLLALSSVQKRTRELGTLKALGWRQRLVVRQVSAESLVQGLFGGVLGAGLGIAGAAVIDALELELEASVAPARSSGPFGQGDVAGASTEVALGAPVELRLLLVAVALAVLGGLLAGAAGGLRAARLRPAEALRSIE